MMALIVQALTAMDFAPAVGAARAGPLGATADANAKTIAHFFIRILLCSEGQAMTDAASGIGLASNYKIARRDFSTWLAAAADRDREAALARPPPAIARSL